MELTHIEHLGIAVKSIEACLPIMKAFLIKMLQYRSSSRPKSKNRIFQGRTD